jgi:Tfp pilus assembly ATPase PilU
VPQIDRYLEFMVKSGASDFHLSSDIGPMYRLHGRMVAASSTSTEPFTSDTIGELLAEVLPSRNRDEFDRDRDTDFAYQLPSGERFRVNAFHARGDGRLHEREPFGPHRDHRGPDRVRAPEQEVPDQPARGLSPHGEFPSSFRA